MMFCRAAWQRLAPLARKTLTPLSSNAVVPVRQMSFGLPASGTNMAYMVLCGGSLTAALVYAYKIINSETIRYNEKIAQMEARSRRAVAEVAVLAEEAVVVETAAAELTTVVEATAADAVVEAVEAEQISESVAAAVEVEAASAIVQAVAAEVDESAPVVEDVAAEAVAPVTETTGEASSAEEAV